MERNEDGKGVEKRGAERIKWLLGEIGKEMGEMVEEKKGELREKVREIKERIEEQGEVERIVLEEKIRRDMKGIERKIEELDKRIERNWGERLRKIEERLERIEMLEKREKGKGEGSRIESEGGRGEERKSEKERKMGGVTRESGEKEENRVRKKSEEEEGKELGKADKRGGGEGRKGISEEGKDFTVVRRRWDGVGGEEARRRRRIVVKGLGKREGEEKESKRWLEMWLSEISGEEIKIREMKRTGDVEKGRGMWVVELDSEKEKEKVLEKKKWVAAEGIWIDEDLNWEERRVRRELIFVAERERRKGKKARVDGKKVWVNEVAWVWDEVKEKVVLEMEKEVEWKD